MIHHVSVGTNDVVRSKRFYDAVLPILGIVPMAEDAGGLGYGSGTFHFSVQIPIDGQPATVGNGSHIAFAVENRSMVDRFYAAALDHGGSPDGAPGLRQAYDANYYAAFVRDPDGHKIEAVTYSAGQPIEAAKRRMQAIGVYAAEVQDATVRLDPSEHSDSAWLSLEECLKRVHYRGLKDGLRSVHEYVTGVEEPAKELCLYVAPSG